MPRLGSEADCLNSHPLQYVNVIDDLGAALTMALEENASDLGIVSRNVLLPPPGTVNRSDGLVASKGRGEVGHWGLDETPPRRGAYQCLFSACAVAEDEVIPAVLSIYVRRGRLPEPGEVLFCNPSTTDEDLDLFVRRFADRKKRLQHLAVPDAAVTHTIADEEIFVIADVHLLGYSKQAMLLGHLRSKVLEGGGGVCTEAEVDRRTGGAVLLVISGKPRQAILSWLSGHMVEIPPLPTNVLRESLATGLKEHYGGE